MARLSLLAGPAVLVGVALAACGGSTAGVGDPNARGSSGSSGSSGFHDQGEGIGIDAGGDSSVTKKVTKVPLQHRATAVACSHDRGPGDADPQIMSGACAKDADCTSGDNGRCNVTKLAARFNVCSYDACFTDSDCGGAGGGTVCTCREAANDANTCTAGNCKIDADCGPGGYCSPSRGFDRINLGTAGYWCHTTKDTCVDDADCDGTTQGPSGAKCAWDPSTTRWSCSNQGFYPPGAGGSGG